MDHVKAVGRIVEVAQAILAGEVDLHQACRQLVKLRHALPVAEGMAPDMLVFVAIESELDGVPIGDVRALWAPEALGAKERERDAYLARVRPSIHEACKSIIEKYRNT